MIKFSELDTTKNCEGMVPAIIQDDNTLQVLMLGYMNAEAYEKTVSTGKVTFYSRTRQCLWTKGETSGHFLTVKSIAKDCDNDTLLIRAIPAGAVCHTGSKTCFNGRETEGFIKELQSVIQGRHREMPEGSYTTKLFTKGVNKIAQKVGEEAVETVIEAIDGNNERLVYEASRPDLPPARAARKPGAFAYRHRRGTHPPAQIGGNARRETLLRNIFCSIPHPHDSPPLFRSQSKAIAPTQSSINLQRYGQQQTRHRLRPRRI